MRPKDLKPPFSWEKRAPLFQDGVFFVPEYFDGHDVSQFPSLDAYFGNHHSICIEFCSGNGEWIIQKALIDKDKNWIAVEKQFVRVRKIWSKMKNRDIKNLLIICGEAETFSHHYLPKSCAESIFINFPDPWPKNRHAKHRLIKRSFVDELARITAKEGFIVTDDQTYTAQILEEMLSHKNWKSVFPAPYFTKSFEDYGTSYFDRLWKNLRKTIHYMKFIKI